jgi:hypothetical protein
MEKSRVLVVGGTGYIGRRLVRASLAQGHPTLVLLRAEIGLDIDKFQMLLSFKAQGARLVEASLEDHAGLLAAVAHANVVVSAMSGAHIRSHNSPKGDTGRVRTLGGAWGSTQLRGQQGGWGRSTTPRYSRVPLICHRFDPRKRFIVDSRFDRSPLELPVGVDFHFSC